MATVRDLMQTEVVTVPPHATVRELTRILSEAGISGVPVVTDAGEVLGVVSSSDVVRLAAEDRESGMTLTGMNVWATMSQQPVPADPEDDNVDPLSAYFLPEDTPTLGPEWGTGPDDGPMDELTVSDIMTPVTFSFPASATVRELADFLVRGKIHRAIVVEDGRLQGIITSMDILKALSEDRL
jgi:CBS domain-containing protein